MALHPTVINSVSHPAPKGTILPASLRKRRLREWIVCCGLVLLGVGARSAGDPDEPPVANQPPGFNGAIGEFRDFATRATPTVLAVGDPLTLTVRITGSAKRPVPRPSLRRLPEFNRQFVIEDLPGPDATTRQGVWEFRYTLKPKPLSPPVQEIPALRFDYYKPGVMPREKGYRTKYAAAIPLTVQPRKEVQATDIQGAGTPIAQPETLYKLVEGPEVVLRQDVPFVIPSPMYLILIFPGVPAVCIGWYWWWRQAFPDATRLTRRRQSQAARRAIHDLETVVRQASGGEGERVARILTGYLRHRWGLAAAEPSPQEVAVLLEQHGCTQACAQQAASFYESCDVARFAPRLDVAATDLAGDAVRLIRDLEDQP
jgi:hypothetical protein